MDSHFLISGIAGFGFVWPALQKMLNIIETDRKSKPTHKFKLSQGNQIVK